MSKKQSFEENDQKKDEEIPQVFDSGEDSDSVSQADSAEVDVEALKKELQQAQEKAAENWDKLLRKEAEMQNVRRRSEIELANAHKYGVERFAQELLAVVDSFEQALSHHAQAPEESAKSFVEGMELTYKQLLNALEKFGVKQIDPIGEPFDPQYHEAISMQESADTKPNHVMAVLQKGFTVHERVLRAARVIIAKAEETTSS